MMYTDDETRVAELKKSSSKILLRDQLDEQDKLIEILKVGINALEENISPILLAEPTEASSGEKDRDAPPSTLAPVQEQVMAQYNRLNNLVARLDNIRRRVQL